MSQPNFPTLLYPNGGETVLGYEITIRWSVPSEINADGRSTVFELYYTDQYDPMREPDWKQIAVLPSTSTQYVWRFGNAIRSNRCRVAIRSRNARGERSRMSVSAGEFSIRRKKLSAPTILSPIGSERVDKFVDIITDDSGIVGDFSERSFYQFYYSSDEAGIPPTSIAQNVPVGHGSIRWNTVDLPAARDYKLQVYLADDDGNVSDSVFVTNIEIAHEGFFIIDTRPPEAAIVVNNHAAFTRSRDVTVSIVSYDDATAVHAMKLIEGDAASDPETPSDVTTFTLSAGDAVKKVELLLQDYGGNRNNKKLQRLFETVVEISGGASVADVAVDRSTNTIWAVTSSPTNYLYKIKTFPSLVNTFEDEPTAVAVYKSFVYVGVKSDVGLGSLYRYNGYEAVSVKDFSESDSTITAMAEHDGKLFIGFENGIVYRYDGLNFTQLSGVDNPVGGIVSDGCMLYLTERSGTDVYIYDGSDFVSTGV